MIERALVLGTGSVITLDDLPDGLREPLVDRREPPSAGQRLADVEREHIDRTLRAVDRQQSRGRARARPRSKDALPEADPAPRRAAGTLVATAVAAEADVKHVRPSSAGARQCPTANATEQASGFATIALSFRRPRC